MGRAARRAASGRAPRRGARAGAARAKSLLFRRCFRRLSPHTHGRKACCNSPLRSSEWVCRVGGGPTRPGGALRVGEAAAVSFHRVTQRRRRPRGHHGADTPRTHRTHARKHAHFCLTRCPYIWGTYMRREPRAHSGRSAPHTHDTHNNTRRPPPCRISVVCLSRRSLLSRPLRHLSPPPPNARLGPRRSALGSLHPSLGFEERAPRGSRHGNSTAAL